MRYKIHIKRYLIFRSTNPKGIFMRNSLIFGFTTLAYLSAPTFVQAGGSEYELVAGQTVELGTVSSGDKLEFLASAGRCYCCEVSSVASGALGVRFQNGAVTGSGSPVLNQTNRGRAEPIVTMSPNDTNGSSRACFSVANSDSSAINKVTFEIRSGADGLASTSRVIASCYETTLSGGFNTSVTDFNFLELTNTLKQNTLDSGVITGTVIARNAITDTEILNQSFTAAPGDRVDIDIHSAAGSGAFGPVTVCHNGPQNSLGAVMSQYAVTSTQPLDFEPVSQLRFQTVGGN